MGDCRDTLQDLPDESVQAVITSPPYFNLRDYGSGTWVGGDPDCQHQIKLGGTGERSKKQLSSAGTQQFQARSVCHKCGAKRSDSQIGLEETPEEYVEHLVEVFREVRRVLRRDGTVWLNLGDSYAGSGKGGNTGTKKTKQDTNRGSTAVRGGYKGDKRLGGLQHGQGARPQWNGDDRPGRTYKQNTNKGSQTVGGPGWRGREYLSEGIKSKDLIGIPWLVAFALRADGWYLRQCIVWHKPNPMPESITDRCTMAHEYIFLLAKSGKPTIWRADDTGEWSHNPDLSERIKVAVEAPAVQGGFVREEIEGRSKYVTQNRRSRGDANRGVVPYETLPRWQGFSYYFDQDAIREPIKRANGGKSSAPAAGPHRLQIGVKMQNEYKYAVIKGANRRSVWTIGTLRDQTLEGLGDEHFAVWPVELVATMIRASTPEGAIILDPFGGSGTTAVRAAELNRGTILCELHPKYAAMAYKRVGKSLGLLKEYFDLELIDERAMGGRADAARPREMGGRERRPAGP